ncbi:cation transporter, partial [Salmonella enterica subsp. enterica serovar Bovismorbificans]|nr:cation transporter [Salmonella enterica subsp. enterica serovar Bovismorbificans]
GVRAKGFVIVKEEGRLFICVCHCLALSTVVN